MVDAIPGRLTEPLQQASQKLGIYLVVGTYERGAERGAVYNSAALLGPNGDVLGVYRKTHLFPTEACGWSTPGNEPVVVAHAARVHRHDHLLRRRLPRAVPRRSDHGCGSDRPAERPAALVRDLGADQPGAGVRQSRLHPRVQRGRPDAGANYYFGHSMIVDPIAHTLAQGRGTEEVIFAELDPDPIKYITYGSQEPDGVRPSRSFATWQRTRIS